MTSLLNNLIPTEFVQAWRRGEYLLGAQNSLDYQYAGWALTLRGYYRYEVCNKEEMLQFGGYTVVDVKRGDLYLAGIRFPIKPDQDDRPIFWETVFSKFQDSEAADIPEIYYLAKLYDQSSSERMDKAVQPLKNKFGYFRMKANNNAFQLAEEEAHSELWKVLHYISEISLQDIDVRKSKSNVSRDDKKCNTGTHGFRGLCRVRPEPDKVPEDGDKHCDLIVSGDYYGVLGSPFLTEGKVTLKRFSESYLRNLDSEKPSDS